MATVTALPTLTAKDLASDQEVRWCPGCGDYSILAQMKKALAPLGIPREKMVAKMAAATVGAGASE